jgi:hypothetical protein
MKPATTAPSRRRTTLGDVDITTPKGVSVHVDPPLPPRRHSYVPGQLLPMTPPPSTPAGDVKRREAELQRQQRVPALAHGGVVDEVPRYVAPRPSVSRTSDGSVSAVTSPAARNSAKRQTYQLGTQPDDAATTTETRKVLIQEPANSTREAASMTREEQEEKRRREIERLNWLEEEKAKQCVVTNAKVIAAAAADVRQQLGQPSYVAIAAQKASGEAQYGEAHQYKHLVADLHQRLGVVPATAEQTTSQLSATSKGHGREKAVAGALRRLPSPANVVEGVTDKALALRRAEMAEMVARLRRLLAEGNVTSTAHEIPILPAAGVVGGGTGGHAAAAASTSCPACDFCIEMTSEEAILHHLIPVLKALTAERVVMPMAGRRGSVSVTSSAASDSAATLDSFRVHSSQKRSRRAVENGKLDGSSAGGSKRKQQQHQQQQEESHAGSLEPSRYAVPRCFRIELVPFSLRNVSIHVSVHDYLAEHFYKAHAQRQDRLFSLALDPPYPETWAEWTAAHRTRLLYHVLDDLLHGGPHPPAPAVTQDITLFPAHVDAMRDALWNSVWTSRSLTQLLTIDESAIASYFGTEVMFYYAWMNHYARWLLGAGVVGVIVSLLSAVQLVDPNVVSGAYDTQMSTFAAAHLAIRRHLQHSLDSTLLPLFIVVMIVGSVLCIKTWERRCSVLTMRYHLFQQEGKDEPRRDFHGTPGRNPVTGEPQLLYPAWYRAIVLQPVAWAAVVLFMAGTIGVMICSLNLDGMVSDPSSRLSIPFLRKYTVDGNVLDATVHPYLAMLPRVGYSVCISTLSYVFTVLAKRLTQMENYRYRGEYVRALMMKRVVFEFVNSYAKLFFVAFGRVSMPELASNLQSILYVAVLSRLMSDTVVPFFVTHRQRVTRRLLRHHEARAAAKEGEEGVRTSSPPVATVATTTATAAAATHGGDAGSPLDEVDELLDPYDVYEDFIEMIIQFGYILLFAAAYPLASFVALLSNIVEVRSDLFKMCYVVRRPVPRLGLQENATWCGIMRVFAMAAVITNTFLLAFTSHQMARWFPEYFVTNSTTTAVPYGSMNSISHFNNSLASATSMPSLADSAKLTNVAIDMIPGRGRVVMFYSMVMEHVMGLVAAFLLWRIPSTPRGVRHYKERRLYERMSRS